MTREELLARARRHMWAAWALSAEEVGSQAAETLLGLGMLVPEGGAAELERLRARVAELEAERHSTNEALDDAVQALRARASDRSADRLTRLLAPTQALREDEPAAEAQRFAYRAEHPDSGITLGTYASRKVARRHCETVARRENPVATFEWRPDGPWREGDDGGPEPGESEELYEYGTHESSTWNPTGYVVTPVEIASAYDEEADE
ncbi:hypothetical protein [Streptomyces sp. Je 1-369]|uniref:hypothetical protein n=1 Tax=Streptomyces sp. Je 1-369 TaxID=2966192 RepID=UPI0022861AC9|nr:hypothetical protein [Streptomyces sp. Je 1-369]WAL93925.1 hypothetical protein NOO62_05100 [Streptomyces sp. Je 1-369]